MMVLRYQRILERQSGYIPIPDSILRENPEKARMMGNPEKFYARYRISAGNNLTAGIVAEKDADSNRVNQPVSSKKLIHEKENLRLICINLRQKNIKTENTKKDDTPAPQW